MAGADWPGQILAIDLWSLSLPDDLVQRQRRCYRRIERIDEPIHRQARYVLTRSKHRLARSLVLGTRHDGHRAL
jgi:hypothetical protein